MAAKTRLLARMSLGLFVNNFATEAVCPLAVFLLADTKRVACINDRCVAAGSFREGAGRHGSISHRVHFERVANYGSRGARLPVREP